MHDFTAVERWLPIPGYEGSYEVSDHGRVRSLERTVFDYRNRPRRLAGGMMLNSAGDPYPSVTLSNRGSVRNIKVHTLVMLAFVGPRPPGLEVRHLNGVHTDAHLHNLTYGTHVENQQDIRRHGKNGHANKTHCLRGHEFNAQNTYRNAKHPDKRSCRACRIARKTESPKFASASGSRNDTKSCGPRQ